MSKNYKIIIWHGVVIVLAWLLWNVGQRVGFNAVTGVNIQFPSLAVFILLTAVVVMGYIMFRQRRWSGSIAIILGGTFLMAYGWNWLNLVSVGIVLGFNFWSAMRVRREINERRILNITDTFYHGLMPVVLGLFVMISFAAYQSPLLSEIKTAQQLPNQTQVIFQQLVEGTFGQKIQAPTAQQRNQLINEIASQTLQQINGVMKPYFRYAPPILAFGLFLILWGLSFLFVWCGVAVGLIIYWILKKTKVVRIEERDTKAEVLIV